MNRNCALTAYDDELPELYDCGIRAIACLLNIQSDEEVYRSAGFRFMCLPIADGAAPTTEQCKEFVTFVNQCRAERKPVAVHCEAGSGRTGTLLAAYLVANGMSPSETIVAVRSAEPTAVETNAQIRFLENLPSELAM